MFGGNVRPVRARSICLLTWLQFVQYADADDINGDCGETYDDDDDGVDDDFKAPGTSAAARKRLEPML